MTSAQTQPTQLDAANDASIEYLGNILDRRDDGDSENDIRDAFRDFALNTGIIADEIREANPHVRWRQMIGMHHRIARACETSDTDIV